MVNYYANHPVTRPALEDCHIDRLTEAVEWPEIISDDEESGDSGLESESEEEWRIVDEWESAQYSEA